MLTDEQRLLLLALAEGTLRDPHNSDELPTNRAVARRLGWSITKFNRKLDNLCNRFTKLGVGGLRGSIDQLATDRRRRLVEHAIESGLIARSQLDRAAPRTRLTPSPLLGEDPYLGALSPRFGTGRAQMAEWDDLGDANSPRPREWPGRGCPSDASWLTRRVGWSGVELVCRCCCACLRTT